MKQMQIPVTLPVSPSKKDKRGTFEQIDSPQINDFNYRTPDPTPAAQRDLYRTCFPDEVRRSPEDNSSPENDQTYSFVNRSVQAFNTPFPVKVVGEVVRVISAIDDNSQQTSSSAVVPPVPSRPAPLSEFKLAVLEPPLSFQDSRIPAPDTSNDQAVAAPISQNVPVNLTHEVEEEVAVDVQQVQENDQAPGSHLPPPPVDVEYSSWALLPTKKFSGFFVEGKNLATGVRANSSRIVERINFLIVRSASGAVIRLVGPPDEKRMLCFYISRSLMSLFSKGFPADWEALVGGEMDRLKNANKGIKDRILDLIGELTRKHEPMSHSRDTTMISASLLSSQNTNQKPMASRSKNRISSENRLQRVAEDEAFRLPPIVETPDSEGPRVGPHHFPIETFTPKNNGDLPPDDDDYEDEEDGEETSDEESEVRDPDEPNSSSSMIESVDLSEADDREHYQRRRARQGNKARNQKAVVRRENKKPTKAVTVYKQSAATTNKKSRGSVTMKPVPVAAQASKRATKKAGKSEVIIATVTKGGRLLKKMDLGRNSLIASSRKEEQQSLSTDLNPCPPSNSKSRSSGSKAPPPPPVVEEKGRGKKAADLKSPPSSSFDLPSSAQSSQVVASKAVKTTTRKRKEPSPPLEVIKTVQQQKKLQNEPPRKTSSRGKKQMEVVEIVEKQKAVKRRSQETEPEQLESGSKRPKKPVIATSEKKTAPPKDEARTTRSRQPVSEKLPVVIVEKLPPEEEKDDSGPRTRRVGRPRKVVEDDKPSPSVQRASSPLPKKKVTTRGKKDGKTVQQQKQQPPKNDEYDFLPESPPKKMAPAPNRARAKQPVTEQQQPVRQPNPMKTAAPTGLGGVRPWSDAEIERLRRAVIQVPTNAADYWKAVGNMVSTRSEEECFAVYNRRPDIQRDTQYTLMMEKLVPNAETSANCPPFSPEKPKGRRKGAAQKKPVVEPAEPVRTRGGKKVITAGVGTLKRREQIRAIVQEEAAEEWHDAVQNDAASHHGGGLTQSERAALLGDHFTQITPSAGLGSQSIVTAGGQALSGFESDGHANSMISSALELPTSKDRQDADKLVQRMRATGATKQQGTKATAGQTVRKKAMVLDHLSPMAGKLKGFLPKNMSTPQIPAGLRHRDDDENEDDDEDTLPESESTLTDHRNGKKNTANNKKKNPLSPIFRR